MPHLIDSYGHGTLSFISASTTRRYASAAANCFLTFGIADEGDVIKCVVAFATHTIKQSKGTRWTSRQILLCELNDCDMVAELFAWPLSVTKHECERAFNHGLVSNLISRLGIDGEIFASGRGTLLRICEKLFDLLRVNSRWLRFVRGRLARFVFLARHL
jgi:hypothetical protein